MTTRTPDEARRLRHIARISGCAELLLALVAILTLANWLLPFMLGRSLVFHLGPLRMTWSVWTNWPAIQACMEGEGWPAAILLMTPRVLLFAAAVWQGLGLLRLYRNAQVFTERNVARLRRIGLLSIAWGLVLVAYPTMLIAAAKALGFAYAGPDFAADWSPVYFVVFGLLLAVMANVMHEAQRLRVDHDLTI